jgi:hypothetical protein
MKRLLLGFLSGVAACLAHAELAPVATTPTTPYDGPAGAWTLVVLPDTQHYVDGNPEVFRRQAEWIVAHRESHAIHFVAHVGDATNNNSPGHWAIVRDTMRLLTDAGLPWSIVTGNKDLGPGGKAQNRETGMNDALSSSDYRNSAAFGLFEPGHLENSWHEFETPTGRHALIALEFGPRDAVLEWANTIAAARPALPVLVVTHASLHSSGTLHGSDPAHGANPKSYGIGREGGANDGVDIWQKFSSRHANIRLVMNGHVTGSGAARLRLTGEAGNAVDHLVANFQRGVKPDRGFGGGGYLRLMRFLPDGRGVEVRTYSPWYDDWLREDAHEFTIKFSPAPAR